MHPSPADTPKEPSAAEHDPPLPLRRLLREQIRSCCVGDDDLNAFVLDYFPAVYQRFTGGMTREAKVTLLLEEERSLPYIAKALSQLSALRDGAMHALPPVPALATVPRPRRGELEQEIVIEEDFKTLSPSKLADLMRIIRRLVGREFKIVLRNCRAGSVILTLRGDWRALTYLMDNFATGSLRMLGGHRVLDVRWGNLASRGPVTMELRQMLRAKVLHCYLAIGWLMELIAKSATQLNVPRWAITVAIIFMLGSVSWATQKVIRIVARTIAKLPTIIENSEDTAPGDEKKSKKHSAKNKAVRTAPFGVRDMSVDLDSSFDLAYDGRTSPDLASGTAVETNDMGMTAHLSVETNDMKPATAPTKLENVYRQIKPQNESQPNFFKFGITSEITVKQYTRCVEKGICTNRYGGFRDILDSHWASVKYIDAKQYCQYIGGRLLSERELLSNANKIRGSIFLDWTAQGKIISYGGVKSRKSIRAEFGYIRCSKSSL